MRNCWGGCSKSIEGDCSFPNTFGGWSVAPFLLGSTLLVLGNEKIDET